MKNTLLYNYNLNAENIKKVDDNIYSFYIDYDKLYFLKVKRPKEDIEEMLKIVATDPNSFHKVILTNQKFPIIQIDNGYYVLIKLKRPEHDELNLRDILLNQKQYKGNRNILDRSNWGALWSEKVDYLEYQVSELAGEHPIIKKSFSYYVGLAENAITYYNMLNPENTSLYISHRRISSPCYARDFYNPLNIVLDFRARDLASYLKIEFFEREPSDLLNEVEFLIEKNVLTPLEYNLLFARLLYPSYYFDYLQKILEKNEDEQAILKYIDKTDEYEKFLNDVWKMFSKKSSMIKIDWLIK